MNAMTGADPVQRSGTGVRYWIPATLLTLAVAATLLLTPYPPLQDFSEWAYQGEILARLARGLPVPEVVLATHPVPNSLAQASLGLLALLLPATLAARLFALALLLASLALALALARHPLARHPLARHRQPAAASALAVVLLVSVLFNATFWNGYVNYQLGLLLFGAWFLLAPERRLAAAPILAFSLLIFFSHAAVFAAFVVVVGLEALLARRRAGAVLGLAPAGLLGLWYVLAGSEGGQPTTEMGGLARFLAYKAYTLVKIGPYHNFVFAGGGDDTTRPAAYWAGAAANLAYATLLLGALTWGLWRALRRRSLPAAPALAAAVLVLLFLALPQNTRGIINPGERLLIPALLVLLLAVPLPAAPLRLAAGLGGVVLAANLLVFTLPGQDWSAPVHARDMEAGGPAGLFRHRPTSFACKWAALQRSEATGRPPDVPLSFQTSLLRSPAGDYFCPAPAGR